MDIDLTVLRSLESKDISYEPAIKEGHRGRPARRLSQVRGRVDVGARRGGQEERARHRVGHPDRPGRDGGTSTTTPRPGFGRIAATTARQVILQRLRDVEDELTFGEYAGREGDIVAGVMQQGKDPRTCWSTWASSRRCCRPPSRCLASVTSTVNGSAVTCCTCARATAGLRLPCRAFTRAW